MLPTRSAPLAHQADGCQTTMSHQETFDARPRERVLTPSPTALERPGLPWTTRAAVSGVPGLTGTKCVHVSFWDKGALRREGARCEVEPVQKDVPRECDRADVRPLPAAG